MSSRFMILPLDVLKILFSYLSDLDLQLISIINKKIKSLIPEIKIKSLHEFLLKLIEYGYLNLLVYYHETNNESRNNNFLKDKTDKSIYTCTAAWYGRLKILKYLRKRGYTIDHTTPCAAATGGSLECLKYLHESNCPWDSVVCFSAAQNGHLECLKYAHENNCPWDVNTTTGAAFGGHIDCLKYAITNQCPQSESAFIWGSAGGQLECLKYLHQVNSAWDRQLCLNIAKNNNRLEIIKWINSLNN